MKGARNMDEAGSAKRYFKMQLIAGGVTLAVSVLAAAFVAAFNEWGPFAPEPKPCLVSGLVFNEVTNEPLAGVIIGLDRWTEGKSSERVEYNATMTGVDGSFTLECRDIPRSVFPLRVVLRHTNWRAVHLTHERIDYGDARTGVNLSVAIRRSDLACPPMEAVRAIAPGPVGDVVTIETRDGSMAYDFSDKRESPDLHAGDFYLSDGSCAQFWANNRGQRGLIDLGDIGVPLDQVRPPPPQAGYDKQGVRALVGHTYVALPKEGRRGFIVFRVLDLNGTGEQTDAYRIQYILLAE